MRTLPMTLTAALLAVACAPAAAQIVTYDESVDGDLSGDGENPTPLGVFGAGVHTITGTMGLLPDGNFDADMFIFELDGLQMNSIFVESITPGDNSFYAIAAGTRIDTNDPNTHLSNILIGGPGEYFDDLANPLYGGSGISGPLGTGTYTVWFQETNLSRDYVMRYSVPLPEPAAAGVGMIALAARATRRRR